MKKCPKCNKEFDLNKKYCDVCGEKLEEENNSKIPSLIYGIGLIVLAPIALGILLVVQVFGNLDATDISLPPIAYLIIGLVLFLIISLIVSNKNKK